MRGNKKRPCKRTGARPTLVRPVRTGCPADPPALATMGFNHLTLSIEFIMPNTQGNIICEQVYKAMVEQLGLTPETASFTIYIKKMSFYATKLGANDVPRLSVDFRMKETGTTSLLVVEDRGTLVKPARVAARYPNYQFQVSDSDPATLCVIRGNGAASPNALAVTFLMSIGWKSNQLTPPDYDLTPLRRADEQEEDEDEWL